MKAKRRHELKENVLAHELGEIKAFFGKYGNWVLAGVTAVAVVLLVVWYYHRASTRREAEEQGQYTRLTRHADVEDEERLKGLVEMVETAKDPVVAAGSAVYLGEFCYNKYVDALRRGNRHEAQDWRKKAEQYFRLTIEKYPDRKVYLTKAHLGLGDLALNAGDLASAEAQYEKAGRSVHAAHPLAMNAQRKLRDLKTLSEPVRFATTTQATQPAAPAASGPATRPTTAPAQR